MAAASQLKSQFGSDHSAAAVGWITRDANLHDSPIARSTISFLDSRGGLEMQSRARSRFANIAACATLENELSLLPFSLAATINTEKL
jgi:hypothetical protein